MFKGLNQCACQLVIHAFISSEHYFVNTGLHVLPITLINQLHKVQNYQAMLFDLHKYNHMNSNIVWSWYSLVSFLQNVHDRHYINGLMQDCNISNVSNGDIKNNAWVTMNNDFWSRVGWFANDFYNWPSHEWKSLANHLTSDQKSLFTVKNVLFYFLHAILYLEHTVPLQTIIGRSFRHCSWLDIVTSSQLICDVTGMRGTGIVTSYSSIVLARPNWHKIYLH